MLCREHGEKMARSSLLKTALFGWWGVISFFTNFGAISANRNALRAYQRLAEPNGEMQLRGPSAAQVQHQSAMWKFLGLLVMLLVLLIVVGVAVTMLTS